MTATGATIYYTTDGTTAPTTETATKGTGSVTININAGTTTTIKAIAVVDGKAPSPVATFNYTINEEKAIHTVTVTAVDDNMKSATMPTVPVAKYIDGTSATITAPAVDDELFQSWTATGVSLSGAEQKNPTITFNVTGNVTLQANYIPVVNTINMTLDAPAAGAALDTALNQCQVKITNPYYIDPGAFDVTWTPSDATAGYNTTYTATIKLKDNLTSISLVDETGTPLPATIAALFDFSAQPTIKVNGATGTLVRSTTGGTSSISYTFPATDPATLLSITQPSDIAVAHGTAAGSFGLPSTVKISVADKSVTDANVSWSLNGTYDTGTTEAQTLTYTGAVTIPGTISNSNNISTAVSLKVYVGAAAQAAVPWASPDSGSYAGAQTVSLTSDTAGATILYSTDGSTPTQAYTAPISVSSGTTINVMARKAGLRDSMVMSYTYTISQPISGGGGGGGAVTVPATSNAGSAQVSAAVTNGTATIAPTDEQIKTVASTTKDTGTVKVDVSSLKADTAVFPAKLVTASEKAMDIKGITLVLPAASVSLDKTALDNVSKSVTESGKDVTVTAKPVAVSSLSETQKTALGSQAGKATVVSVSMLVGDTKVTAFGGGSATISVPYTLKTGETAGSITVWYLADDGTISPMHGKYDAATKTVSFTTTHLSDYAVVSFPFTDVSEDAWYYGDVAYAYVNGLFSGTSNTAFSPALTMNRAMLVTVLWRLAGKPVVNYAMNFSDVAADTYYTEAVRWAASNKIVTGYSSSSFGPSDTVTREQMAAILYRYAQFKKYDVSIGEDTNILSYTDAFSVSEYAMPAMQWACGAELIKGSDGKLLPKDGAQRCQVAAILTRFCKNVVK